MLGGPAAGVRRLDAFCSTGAVGALLGGSSGSSAEAGGQSAVGSEFSSASPPTLPLLRRGAFGGESSAVARTFDGERGERRGESGGVEGVVLSCLLSADQVTVRGFDCDNGSSTELLNLRRSCS